MAPVFQGNLLADRFQNKVAAVCKNVERKSFMKPNGVFFKLFKYSLTALLTFSQAPLSIASISGLVFTFIAFFMILFVVVRRLILATLLQAGHQRCVLFYIYRRRTTSSGMGIMDNIWLKHIWWKSRAARIISSAKPTTKTLSWLRGRFPY